MLLLLRSRELWSLALRRWHVRRARDVLRRCARMTLRSPLLLTLLLLLLLLLSLRLLILLLVLLALLLLLKGLVQLRLL